MLQYSKKTDERRDAGPVSKWYAYAKWVLERMEDFPKGQRFILGQPGS